MEPRSTTELRKRVAALFLAVWFAFLSLLAPFPAAAQWVVSEPLVDVEINLQRVERALLSNTRFQIYSALINAMNFFVERILYETAVWVASGGKAESPLFDGRTAGQFVADSAFGAGLNFIDDLDRGGFFGFENGLGVAEMICQPPLPQLRLAIQLGLTDRLHPREPLCSWSEFTQNWDRMIHMDSTELLKGVGVVFEPGQSDLAAGLDLHVGVGEKLARVPMEKFNKWLQDNAFSGPQNTVSEWTKTPAALVKEKTITELGGQANLEKTELSNTAIQNAVASSVDFWSMLGQAGQAMAMNFAITLASQTAQQQLFNRGFIPITELWDRSRGSAAGGNANASPSSGGREAAEAVYAEFVRPNIATAGNYDVLVLFASCDPQNRLQTTCVMNDKFAQAVRAATSGNPFTVREAFDAQLLEDFPFIPFSDGSNEDPNCFRANYCASNLVKLRSARIIPIGWELAANHSENAPGNRVTLRRLLDEFDQNGLDGVCGTRDIRESPFCGLVDPNWVLRYPGQQCLARGPSELLLRKDTNLRADACADAPSCLAYDAEGNCSGGYGYCLTEENAWRVRGRTCPAYAASCRSVTGRDGAELNVLTSTVDRNVCNAGNVGCQWYSTEHGPTGEWNSGERRYFNRLVSTCEERSEGCTDLVPVATSGLNLFLNGGFEGDVVGVVPARWEVEDDPAPPNGVTLTVRDGGPTGKYLRCQGSLDGHNLCRTIAPTIDGFIQPGGVYTLSGSVRVASPLPQAGSIFIGFQPSGAGTPFACLTSIVADASASTWRQFSATCRVETEVRSARIVIYDSVSASVVVDVDNLMLISGDVPGAFHDGYASDAPRTYLRVAPADLRCYDVRGDGSLNTDNDPADGSCNRFASGCSAADVGCERYTPTDGAPPVAGQYAAIDQCPRACVGYAAYREVSSNFDEARVPFNFFIPDTARQCEASQVGCAEFTNLDALERGGESREYFSFLRRCEKPGEASGSTYYTWEGSETAGYQLRSFVLQRSVAADANSAPFVFGYGAGGDPEPDCGPAGTNHYGASPGEAEYDATVTPDCRAFYSQDGTINYRRLSRTVLMTDECVRYRASHEISASVCTRKGGTVTEAAGGVATGCVFKGHRQASTQCTAEVSGCRAYRGNTSGAIRTIVASDFESVDGDVRQGWSTGTQTSESLIVGGHSLRVGSMATTSYPLRQTLTGLTEAQCAERGGTFAAGGGAGPDSCTNVPVLMSGNTYELTIIARGSGAITATFNDGAAPAVNLSSGRNATLTPTWQRIVLGPFIVGENPRPTASALLSLAVSSGGTAYLDQIIVRESPQAVTVIEGSWQTPQACDRASIASDSAPQPQGMLGCRLFRDRTGAEVPLRSFGRLCSPEAVGCTAFYDTRNSDALLQEDFNGGGAVRDGVTVPADGIRYVVDDFTKRCEASFAGCMRFGLPQLERAGIGADGAVVEADDGIVAGWSNAFFIDDPDRYDGPSANLCTHPELFCEEFRGKDGGLFFFKHPFDRTCRYREDVTYRGIQMDGWFRGDTDEPCDETFAIRGAEFGIRTNNDARYEGWAGTCEVAQDQCIALRDPTDVSVRYPEGETYAVIRDASLDLTSCAGDVSRKDGCAMFDDVTNPIKHWSAAVTYVASDLRNGEAVAPIDCDRNPILCRRCIVERVCRLADGTPQDGDAAAGVQSVACVIDSECDANGGYMCNGGDTGGTCATVSPADAIADGQCSALSNRAVCRQFQNDVNLIAKVRRDRQCSEWLTKDGCYQAWVPGQSRVVESCTGLQREGGGDGPGDDVTGAVSLTTYQKRDRSWGAAEPSGWTIPDQPSPEKLEQVSFRRCGAAPSGVICDPNAVTPCSGGGRCETKDFRLSFVYCPASPTGAQQCGEVAGSCGASVQDGAACGPTLPAFGGTRGICLGGRCAYGTAPPSDAARARQNPNRVNEWPEKICKVFPESDAPFPDSVVDDPPDGPPVYRSGFSNVNVCESGECSCSYAKLIFGNNAATKYYPQDSDLIGLVQGVCIGGARDGELCSPSAPPDAGNGCGAEGRCEKLKRRQVFNGIEGYCLEEDRAMHVNGDQAEFACLDFLPIDQLAGSIDVNSQVATAGLQLPDGMEWYCAGKREGTLREPLTFGLGRLYAVQDNLVMTYGTWTKTLQSRGTPQPFGAPRSMPQGTQLVLGGDGNLRSASWVDNCERSNHAGWCGIPSKDRPEFGEHWTPAEDSNFYEGAYNFFGCYEYPDDYPNEVYYPWELGPIYKWQLADMKIHFLDGDTRYRCKQFTHEDSETFYDKTVSFNPGGDYTYGKVLRAFVNGRDGGNDGDAHLHAVFDANDKFLGIGIEAKDPHDEGSFFLSKLEFIFKPGCDVVARVTDGTKLYPFTDRTWQESGFRLRGYAPTQASRPWGGILEDGNRYLSSAKLFVSEEVDADVPYTAALFRWPTDLRELFAKSYTVLGLNDTVPAVGGTPFSICVGGAKEGDTCSAASDCRYPTPDAASSPVACEEQPKKACRTGTRPSLLPGVADSPTAGQSCTTNADCGTGGACEPKVCVEGERVEWGCRNNGDCPGGTCETIYDHFCSGSGVPSDIRCSGAADCRETAAQCVGFTGVPTLPVPFTYSAQQPAWDVRADVGSTHANPKVSGVGACDPSTGQCKESSRLLDTITINGQSDGDVVGTGGQFRSNVQFFYWVDPNHMPVRRIVVAYGDDATSYDPGDENRNSFANRRGLDSTSNESMCNDDNFGQSTLACVERPFTIAHTYACSGAWSGNPAKQCGADGRPTPGQREGCWDASFIGPGGRAGACVFVPRVHIKDNWGFCTGTCPNAASYAARADGDKCFDGTGMAGDFAMRTNECGVVTPPNNAWTYFQGRVIVGPP